MGNSVFDRVIVTDAIITGSNISENDHPEFSAGATYAVGDRVIKASAHTIYESVQAGNQGNEPTTDDGTWWVAISATNYWKPFDETLSDPAKASGLISYTFAPSSRISGIFLSNLDADQVTITVTRASTTRVFARRLLNLDHIQGPYTWLFGGRPREPEALFTQLPWLGAGTTYTVEVTGAGIVCVGEIVLGDVIELGTTPWGATIGIYSPSTKTKDGFGNDVIVQRSSAQIARIPFQVTNANARRVQRLIQKFEATPTVWIGDERPDYALILFGILKDYNQVLSLPTYSSGYIEVEGRT